MDSFLLFNSFRKLLVKGFSLLWSNVLHYLNASFYTLRLQGETWLYVGHLGDTEFTYDVRATLETYFFWCISTGKVVGDVALFVTFNCAEHCGSHLFANLTASWFKFLLSKVKVQKLTICRFFDFFCPEGAVNVHKLVDMEWNKPSSDCAFSIKFA